MSPHVPLLRWTQEHALIERLVQQHHLREADALHAVQTYGVEGARGILGYVRQEVGQRKGTPEEIRNVSAYLARCFREGYGRKGELEREAERVQAAQMEQAAVTQQAVQTAHTAHEQARAATNATLKEQTAEAVERWSALPEAQQAALEQRFLQEGRSGRCAQRTA